MATNFDPDAIRESAKKLGSIMDDMAAFEALKANWPNAGGFELAQRVERVVDDRRNGVVANAEHLKIALDDMRSTLTKIADDFEKADEDNAAKIKASIGNMASEMRSDIARFDQNTEQDQHNFTPGPKAGSSGSSSDGDGYNDVLSSDDTDVESAESAEDTVTESAESSVDTDDENNSDGDGYDDVLPSDGTQSFDSSMEDLESLEDSVSDEEVESDLEPEEEPKGDSDGYIAK
ncbi:hypothetical protein [Lentzea cavernae]|uniref:Excreted virulence factor EspC, type VII ESX diderm n=1 Tax=Lentzea cavernae TaxID=2020703 RepID=A0ABQ3MS21_9PSEU|nr:hypothetical protein [Lentzea cavernae]GHH56510.1 hypothetical protein GCM10017774_74710 [Lentzea cavernae]